MTEKQADEPRGWGIRTVEGRALLWWKDGGNGYTDDIARAGLFSEAEAMRHNGPRHEGADAIVDQPIPPDEMLRRTQEETRRLETRLGNLIAFRNRLREVTQ